MTSARSTGGPLWGGYCRPGNPAAAHSCYYQCASNDPDVPQLWAYMDDRSYAPGEIASLHVNTTAATFDMVVYRDGAKKKIVLQQNQIPGSFHHTPTDCSINGCDWPVSLEISIEGNWSSGGYVVELTATAADGSILQYDHVFLLRPGKGSKKGRLLLVAAAGTWTAYNDWGGSNHYEGITGLEGTGYSPILSLERPWARGFVVLPEHAPRAALAARPRHDEPVSYPHMDWAYENGYSKKYASAGWASYERHFMNWASGVGFQVDIASQYDLQYRPEIIADYTCLVFIGHDEYWSWEMRDTVDAYVEGGGKVARFAGNFMWQTRLESEGQRQVCYKYRARSEDPLRDTPRVSTAWEASEIARPGALTFGLNATRGFYAGWGGCAAFGAGGFPIYRPEHWAFEGTGLGYGDVLGAESRILAYEVDGLDYIIRHGLPFPSGAEEVPAGIEILGLGLASNIEVSRGVDRSELFLGSDDCDFLAEILYGEVTDETTALAGRGSGMVVSFKKGLGEVFHAGSCEWVAGLLRHDPQVERVTRNVLSRFLKHR